MRFSVATVISLLAISSASAIPSPDVDIDMSPNPRGILDARDDSYDCKGSSMCKTLQVRACDDAVNNKLKRNDDVNYGADGYVELVIQATCMLWI
jgi:hypothetical protein